jgi:hypothetical protein
MTFTSETSTSANRRQNDRRKDRRQASRIQNGSALLPGVDGRSVWVRRAKERIVAHTQDRGGEAACSAAEQSLIRRASVLEVELEQLEARFANAGSATPDEVDLYARVSSNLRRLLEAIAAGLARRPRDISGDDHVLQAYMEEYARND